MSEAVCELQELHGLRLLLVPGAGPPIGSEAEADAILGEAWGREADMAVIPAARLAPEFFRLETGFAGRILQKFTTYRLRVAVLGDLALWTERSRALSAFVAESNRGEQIWFLAAPEDLERRLAQRPGGG